MSNNEALSGGDLTRTAARWFMGARGGLEVTRADMQNARCLLGDLLAAVADDLEGNAEWLRLAWRQTAFADLASEREKKTTVQQWIDAAERVRDLLKEGQDQ